MPGDPGHRAFLLLGPTAVGKSEFAVALAERVGGEIVSGDAFQIYAGLDILGAKPPVELQARVPHHLIGEVPLTDSFDVARWLSRARRCIADITARGRVPIVSGGTGLYIRALTHGLAELPPANPALRSTLEAQSLPALVERLRALDPATTVDTNNPRRVIRALEVCILTGRPFSSFRSEWERDPACHGVIVTRQRADLDARINARTRAMFAAGVVREVATTGAIGATAAQMLGLREIRALLAQTITPLDCIAAIDLATRHYARRQLTWLRKERGYEWLDLTSIADPLKELQRAAAEFRARRLTS
jgi:tRNA dimethylallyltransferase